jgi:hypothetical protein
MIRIDLEPTRDAAPIRDLSLEDLVERRERKMTSRRVGALAVSFAIILAMAGAFVAVNRTGTGTTKEAGTTPEAWTMPPGLAIPAGSYAYVHVINYPPVGNPTSDEQWWWFSPTDGTGRVKVEGIGGDHVPYSSDTTYGPSGEMTDGPKLVPLDGLSTDPALLADQLFQRAQEPGSPAPTTLHSPQEVADVANILLNEANATPELKAALSQVLVNLPGVTIEPDTADPVGRSGWSVQFTDPDGSGSRTWWFDRDSDQLLAVRNHFTANGGYTYFSIYEASGVVADTSAMNPEPTFIPPTTDAPPAEGPTSRT